MCRRVLTGVFTRRTRRFVSPSDHRRHLRLAMALIRLLRSTDVQSQSVQADPSLRTSFIVGFAMHRLMRKLFVQTLTLSTLGTIFSRWHFEIFFSFFQENRICTSCKLSPLHEMSNPVFLVMKRKEIEKQIQSVVCWISPESPFWRRFPAVALGLYNTSLLLVKEITVLVLHVEATKTEHFTWKWKVWRLLYKPINKYNVINVLYCKRIM